jgi:hypothetical protein
MTDLQLFHEKRKEVALWMHRHGDISTDLRKKLAEKYKSTVTKINIEIGMYRQEKGKTMFASPHTKKRVFNRDNYTCQYCSIVDEYVIAEHVIPYIIGGAGLDYNLVAACWSCNMKKRGGNVWIPKNFNVLYDLNKENAERILKLAVKDFRD